MAVRGSEVASGATAGRCATPTCLAKLDGMAVNTPPNSSVATGVDGESKQYSLSAILGIWAAVTVPMGLLAFLAAPALIAQSTLKAGLVFWMLMVVGMVWQFAVSVTVLRIELGTLRWAAVKERIWQPTPQPEDRRAAAQAVVVVDCGDRRQRPHRRRRCGPR